MVPVNVAKEYSKILKRYLQVFKLESIDIAFLIGTKKEVIEGLLSEKKGVVLKTLELISQIFGLRYFQFGNPDFEMPSFDSLPEATKARIAFRKKEGPHEETTYSTVLLNEKIIVVLSEYKKGDEFLAKHIVKGLSKTSQESSSTSEVGKRLTESLDEYVLQTTRKDESKTGKGRKPFYFRLIKKIPAKVLKEAKEKIAEAKKDEIEKIR